MTIKRITPNEIDRLIEQASAEEWTRLALVGPGVSIAASGEYWQLFDQGHQLSEYVDGIAERIRALTKLTSLSLPYNGVGDSDAQHLAALTNLTSLDLSGNQVGDSGARHLAALTNLTSLDLSINRVGASGAQHLAALTNLTTLDLPSNQVGDSGARHLTALTNLTSLDLSNNQIGDSGVQHFAALTNLTSLDLSGNRIGDSGAQHLAALTNLTSLDLSDNQVGDSGAQHLAALTNLTSLDLSDNQVGDSGVQHLTALTNLTSLSLFRNQVGDSGAQHLATLTNLTSLYLSDNQVGTSGAQHLTALTNLTSLSLSRNQVGASGVQHLTALTNLTSLYLSGNQVGDSGAQHLTALTNLTSLYLSRNQVGDSGAQHLAALTNLTSLYLSGNQVGDSGAQHLAALTNLTSLGLANNKVSDLTPLRGLIENGLMVRWKKFRWEKYGDGLLVEDCPLTHPPVEVVKAGHDAVLNYFKEIDAQGTDQLFEAKVLFVGEGRAGKTSLLRRLFHPELELPGEDETTQGIDIHRHEFPLENGRSFRLNAWDFGGQDIYHATHQFFLTKRSLYVLLDDTAKDHKTVHDPGFKYWLEVIEVLTDRSPVLLFQNEKGGRSKTIDIGGIKGRFPNVKEVYRGNLEHTGAAQDIGAAIKLSVRQLPHIGDEVPAKWVSIRADLEKRAEEVPYISEADYFAIYRRHLDFDPVKARHLSRYLHDLGVFLHFQDHALLGRTVILQNEWATQAVFKVLDDEQTKAAQGRFTGKDCAQIWSGSAYAQMHIELLALMEQFELCYRLPDLEPPTWLAPQLLSPVTPEQLDGWDAPGDLSRRYRYGFLPKGLISRLIVRMNRYVRKPELAWTNGALFENDGARVLVRITARGDISLRARGPERKELFSVIAADLDTLNHSFGGLHESVEVQVPCICTLCAHSSQPEYFATSNLRRRRQANQQTIECGESYENVSVMTLLDGLWPEDFTPNPPTNPDAPKTARRDENPPRAKTGTMRTCRIFLASSAELREDRDAFDLYFRQQNDWLRQKEGLYLEIIRWENSSDAMSSTRSQDEYNTAIRRCDIFVALFSTKAGTFTDEEFEVACETFKETGRPKIYTFFKSTTVNTATADREALQSLWAFQDKLEGRGHFYTGYDSIEQLKRQFSDQLRMLLESGALSGSR